MVLKPKPKEKKEDIKKSLASHHHRSMFDPRTGGVAQQPRKTKKNGVKNLKRAYP